MADKTRFSPAHFLGVLIFVRVARPRRIAQALR